MLVSYSKPLRAEPNNDINHRSLACNFYTSKFNLLLQGKGLLSTRQSVGVDEVIK